MKDKFTKILFLIFGSLSVGIALFIILNIHIRANVKEVVLSGDKNSLDLANQILKIKLSHSVQKQEIENSLTIMPPIASNITWPDNKTLEINFKEPLQADTKYLLKINSTKKGLPETFSYEFKTKALKVTYIEKTKESSLHKIVESDINFSQKKVLFEKNNIKQFSRNKEFVVVLTLDDDKTNSLFLVNINNGSVDQIDIGASLVSSVSMSPTENKFVFNRSDAIQRGSDVIPSQEYNLNIYDIPQKKFIVINPQNTAAYILNAFYSPDGSAILYQTDASLYYLVDTKTYENVIAVGKHDATGGFNFEKNKIVFNDIIGYSPGLVLYNTNRQEAILTSPEIYPIDPTFSYTSDDIYFSQKIDKNNPSSFLYEIYSINSNRETKSILKQEGKSLEGAKISPDNRYLLIERFDDKKVVDPKDFRLVGFQVKPGVADIIVFDLKENKILDQTAIGANAIWGME